MELKTVKDIEDASGNLWETFPPEAADRPLSDFDHLVISMHDRVIANDNGEERDLTYLPPAARRLFETPDFGPKLYDYGMIRSDTGAREITEDLTTRLGEKALLIRPKLPRGIVDPNRPRRAALEIPFPEDVKQDLLTVHERTVSVLWATYEAMKGNLKSLTQPHTMASGEPDAALYERISQMEKDIAERHSADVGDYIDHMLPFLEAWRELYNGMCNTRGRDSIDVISSIKEEGGLRKLKDGGFAEALSVELNRVRKPWVFDKPFPHVPGYPGSDLVVRQEADGIAGGALDVPRHLILEYETEEYDALFFKPDPHNVALVAQAIERSIEKCLSR